MLYDMLSLKVGMFSMNFMYFEIVTNLYMSETFQNKSINILEIGTAKVEKIEKEIQRERAREGERERES